MKIGLSTACLYPQLTELALRQLIDLKIENAEVFFNSRSEIDGEIFEKLLALKNRFGINLLSGHGFANSVDGYFLFSSYERRRADSLQDYCKIFEAEQKLNIPYHIIHGPLQVEKIDVERYCEHFSALSKKAKEYGITVLQENVNKYKSGSNEFIKQAKAMLGSLPMVIDVKQARRSNADLFELVEIAGKDIRHLHLSDFDTQNDCILPNENGLFDFAGFIDKVLSTGAQPNAVIEVYSNAFSNAAQLKQSLQYLQSGIIATQQN